MFRHNLLLTYRSFKRFKSSFFINLFGLSIGLTCTILIYLWVNDELKVDAFHGDRLFQVMEHQDYTNEVMTGQSTPGLLAETLKEEFPEVQYAATGTWIMEETLSYEDKNIKSTGYSVGSDYFNIFSFPLIQGDPDQVLADKNSIVISASTATRLFGTTNVIGKRIEWQHQKTYLVSGVFEDLPALASLQFDFVLSFEVFKDDNDWVKSWGNNGPRTFLLLSEGTDYHTFSNKIGDFIKTKTEESNVTLFLMPFSELYLKGRFENGVQSGGRIEYIRLFSVIAIFILLIACINFMNLSTARASRRAKEVGVKKAMGVPKQSLIFQFMSEAVVMSLTAMITALILVVLVLPEMNEITGKQIAMSWDAKLIGILFSVTILTGLISGSYPALYLSTFNPVAVLKGELKSSIGELWARRGLVVFQFALSIVLIISVFVIYKQVEFVQEKNLGYNKDNVISFHIDGRVESHLQTFIHEVSQIEGVKAVSSIAHNFMGQMTNTSGLDWDDKDPDESILFEQVRVNYDMIETMGIKVKEGRPFSRDFKTDSAKIIFNEAAIKIMGLEDPVGKKITLWDEYKLEIIGVVKDFHFQSLHESVNPLFMILRPDDTWSVMVRIAAGSEKQTLAQLKAFYEEFNVGFAFDYEFMDQQYQSQYAAEQRVSTLSKYFAGIAMIISCLGLFGLAAFTAERRLKEIGIRKVLGSSAFNIVYLLTADFSKLVIISIAIGTPLAYFFLKDWLDRFAYRIELEGWFFLSAGLIALVIAWLAVSYQALKAAHINPIACLRDE